MIERGFWKVSGRHGKENTKIQRNPFIIWRKKIKIEYNIGLTGAEKV